jgi:IS1 family transposase
MIYLHLKGKHWAEPRKVRLHTGIYQKQWHILLERSCYYKFGTADDKDWNKLCGWTTDLLSRNSLRIGWRPYSTELFELVAYIHKDGKRYTVKGQNWSLGRYEYDSWVWAKITHDEGMATFSVGYVNGSANKTVSIGFDACICPGYLSNPYFGGNNPAPHDMALQIVEI